MPNPLAIEYGPTPQEQMAQLASVQSQTQLRQAQTQEAQNNTVLQKQAAQKGEMELEQARKWQEVLRNAAANNNVPAGSVPPVSDIPASLDFMSNLAMNAQDPERAAKLATEAAGIRQKQATAQAQQLLAKKHQAEVMKQHMTVAADLADTVKDDASLERYNTLFAMETGQASPFMGMKYKDVAEDLKNISTHARTQHQRIDDQIKAEEAKSREANRQDQIRSRQFRDAQAAALQPLKERVLANKTKAGGKSIGEPTAKNIELTYADLKAQNDRDKLGLDDTELLQKARAVESQVKAMMLAHHGLNADDARRQARQGLNMKAGVTYQDGSTASQALPVPPDGQFEDGKFYAAPKGGVYQVVKRDGKWVPIKIDVEPSAAGVEVVEPLVDDETPPDDAE